MKNSVATKRLHQNNSNTHPQNNDDDAEIPEDDTKTNSCGLHVNDPDDSSKEPPKDKEPISVELEPTTSEDWVGVAVALASDPEEYTPLTTKQAWALIDQTSLEIDQTNDATPQKSGDLVQ